MATATNLIDIIISLTKKGSGGKEASKELQGLNSELKTIASGLAGGVVQAASFSGAVLLIASSLKMAINAAAESEAVMAGLDATIQSMGRSGEISSDQIAAISSELMKISTFDDEAINRASEAFLRVESVDPSNMQKLLAVTADFAAGTRQGIIPAAETIAMALETGQTRALHFDRALQKQIRSLIDAGKEAEALALIVDKLGDKFGGQAAVAADTWTGKIERLKNEWGEFWEMTGEGAIENKGFISNLTRTIENYNAGQQRMNDLNKYGIYITQGLGEGLAEYNARLDLAIQEAKRYEISQEDIFRAQRGITEAFVITEDAVTNNVLAVKDLQKEFDGLMSFSKSYTEHAETIKALEAELSTATGKHYGEVKAKLEEARAAQKTWADQFVLDMMKMQLAADGNFTPEDQQKVMDMALKMGLLDQKAIDYYYSLMNLNGINVSNNVWTYYHGVNVGGGGGGGGGGGVIPSFEMTTEDVVNYGPDEGNPIYGGRQAAGGDYIVDRPTMFIAGDAGAERATFTPLSGGGGYGGGIVINVNGAGDPRRVARAVADELATRLKLQGVQKQL
jgi:hypothetical protein